MTLLAIAAGGALGAVLRYLSVSWLAATLGRDFPWGTLGVNALGSLLIGAAYVWFETRMPGHAALRAGIVVGVLGGFTTFSAFSLETLHLLVDGEPLRALGNAVASVVLCVAGAAAGYYLSRHVLT